MAKTLGNISGVEQIEQTSRISEFASGLVENGDMIALDTGSTTFELAKFFTRKRHLTIVTND